MSSDDTDFSSGISRRCFLQAGALTCFGLIGGQFLGIATARAEEAPGSALASLMLPSQKLAVSLEVNSSPQSARIDSRRSLLDLLREDLKLTGTKKGCDHGQCGACTVLVTDRHGTQRRILSCLTLAAQCQNKKITTIEGLGTPDDLHPVQEAFVEHDAFQCGFCTSGQICSAVAALGELDRGEPSFVGDVARKMPERNRREIQERLSGNLCRCGAYSNIVDAVRSVGSQS